MSPESAAAAREETVKSGERDIFVRSWQPSGTARAVVVLVSRLQLAQRLLHPHRRGARRAWHRGLRARPARARPFGRRAILRRVDIRVRAGRRDGGVARQGRATPASPIFLLGHSAGGVVSCLYALEHQDELAGFICESFAFQVPAPDFAIAALKGLSHLAPHAHVLKLKNEDFSRDPAVVKAMNDDPLIAQRDAADAHRRRAGARGRAAAHRVSADHAAAPHPARHGGQGDQAERKPDLLRHGRIDGQDAQAVRGALPRSAERRRQGGSVRRHRAVDRCAGAAHGFMTAWFTRRRGNVDNCA